MQKRHLASLFFFGLLAAAPARAGDVAGLDVLGFDAQGGIFAFEEYGIQDGSGFPYSNRFYIDTTNDSFLPGTPIRVRLDDEAATLANAREQSRERGQEIAQDAELASNRGFAAGVNAVTETSADPFRMSVNPRPVFPPVDDALEIRLEEVQLPQPSHCDGIIGTTGFRLLRIAARDGGRTRLLHEDERIPASRGCPLGYHIGGIQTFFPEAGEAVYAVLVAIRSFGFEGPDYRWIALTRRLKAE
jgi:predicted secreted protein